MSLDALVEEIRRRSEGELREIETRRADEERRLGAEREARIAAVRQEQARLGEVEASRLRAQLLAAATVNARKRLYEARERRLRSAVEATRDLLQEYARTDGYTDTLRLLAAEAAERLGKQLRITGRSEDAARLGKIAGRAFDASPAAILGGLIAETSDGSRRLDLSFDELLRLREPRVRELLA